MSIEMIAYDPVQEQVCWLTLREGFSNPTAAFGPGLAEYRPPPKTADSPWLPRRLDDGIGQDNHLKTRWPHLSDQRIHYARI
jgi:hypothetical protein